MCVSKTQWLITAKDGTQLTNAEPAVRLASQRRYGRRRAWTNAAPARRVLLLWTADGADINMPRRALFTFWADSLDACDSDNAPV